MKLPDAPSPTPPTSSEVKRRRLNLWTFFGVLLAPALLTILSVLIVSKEGDTAPTVAVLGGGLAGIIAGIMLGRRIGSTTQTKVITSIIFVPVMAVVCIGMSCCGCMVSGYQLRF